MYQLCKRWNHIPTAKINPIDLVTSVFRYWLYSKQKSTANSKCYRKQGKWDFQPILNDKFRYLGKKTSFKIVLHRTNGSFSLTRSGNSRFLSSLAELTGLIVSTISRRSSTTRNDPVRNRKSNDRLEIYDQPWIRFYYKPI